MTWSEVLGYHRTRKGVGRRSLLVDRGESGYRNRFLPDGRILYMGEGKRGDQEPVGGNLRLLLAHREGTPLTQNLHLCTLGIVMLGGPLERGRRFPV
ncbi:hypothetical protein TthSNM11_17700 [Thermus thermophilus]|nr:hypothetical protein TthSNM11_17700 [Thermus thermophilus]